MGLRRSRTRRPIAFCQTRLSTFGVGYGFSPEVKEQGDADRRYHHSHHGARDIPEQKRARP